MRNGNEVWDPARQKLKETAKKKSHLNEQDVSSGETKKLMKTEEHDNGNMVLTWSRSGRDPSSCNHKLQPGELWTTARNNSHIPKNTKWPRKFWPRHPLLIHHHQHKPCWTTKSATVIGMQKRIEHKFTKNDCHENLKILNRALTIPELKVARTLLNSPVVTEHHSMQTCQS